MTTKLKDDYITPLTYNEIKGEEDLKIGKVQRQHTVATTRWMLLWGLDLLKNKEMRDMPERVKSIDISEVPNWLLKYWKKRDKDIEGLSPESKEKITGSLSRIKIIWGKEVEGHNITIKMWDKTIDLHDWSFYNTLNWEYHVKIKNDWVDKTGVEWSERSYENSWVTELNHNTGYPSWKNDYYMLSIEDTKKFLKKLWDFAGLDDEKDQIAMLMALTGMYWNYRIPYWTSTTLICHEKYREIEEHDYHGRGVYSVFSIGRNSNFLNDKNPDEDDPEENHG